MRRCKCLRSVYYLLHKQQDHQYCVPSCNVFVWCSTVPIHWLTVCTWLITGQSGHAFCHECIQTWLAQTPTCPVCRDGLTAASLTFVRSLQPIIGALPMKCFSCDWTGTVDENHDAVCPGVKVPCHNQCGKEIRRGDIHSHGEVCEMRLLKCGNPGCSVRMKGDVKMKAHREYCKRPCLCCECNTLVPAYAIKNHETVCQLRTVVPCTRECDDHATDHVGACPHIALSTSSLPHGNHVNHQRRILVNHSSLRINSPVDRTTWLPMLAVGHVPGAANGGGGVERDRDAVHAHETPSDFFGSDTSDSDDDDYDPTQPERDTVHPSRKKPRNS